MRAVHGRRRTDTGDEISLGAVARAVWRNKRAIAGPTLLIAAAAFAVVNLVTPRYKSEARVLVEGRENIFLRPEAEKQLMDRGPVDPETVTSQVQLVLSRDLARKVIEELNLAENPEFNAALKELSPLQVLRSIGILRDPMSMSLEERVLAAYYERLTAFAVDKSRVISIEFQSGDPQLAPRIANLIAEKYLTLQQVAKQDQARSASKWLSGELEKLRDKVSEAESKVEEYRARYNLFFGSGTTTLSNQQLTDLNSQVSAARAQKADAEARAGIIRETLRSGQSLESSDIVNSELIRRLSEQRVTLRAQLAEQSSTLLPQHPRIRQMRAQIDDLDQQIRSEGERLARSLENEARVAVARLETLSATLDQAKRLSASTSEQDVQLRALEREAKAQKDLFESYLAKYREATARDSIAAAPADARIISRAVVSNIPFYPKKVPILLIASLGTFSLAIAFVVTGALLGGESPHPAPLPADAAQDSTQIPGLGPTRRERISTRWHTGCNSGAALPPPERGRVGEGINRLRKQTPTLTLPLSGGGNSPPGLHHSVPPPEPAPVAGTGIKEIAASLLQQGDAGGHRVAVIGAARDVGTTLSAIALARRLAWNSRVVLVDLALGSPNIDVISSDPSAPGIAELVRGEASFGDIIIRDRATRLHLVAAGQAGNDAEGILASEMLWAAIGALAQSYDHLVIDAGAQSPASLRPMAQVAPFAVLVGGTATAPGALTALSDALAGAGFAHVSVLTGPPPALDPAPAVQSAA